MNCEFEILYNGQTIIIQCLEKDKMKDLIERFCTKASAKKDSIYFLYKGNQIDENSSLEQILKSKTQNEKITLIAYEIDEEDNKKNEALVKSPQIICPNCKDIGIIQIKNYKINIECKNNHKTENISFENFEKTQKIDESKIICDKCGENNKSESFNKEFHYCLECKKNFCTLCKSKYYKEKHNLVNYDQKNFICPEHEDNYNLYCISCKKNLCAACENEHSNDEIKSLGKLFPKKNELNNRMKNLKENIDKLKEENNKIIGILNNFMKNLEIFYNIHNDINNSFNIKYKNYETLKNIQEINEFDILKDLNEIINEKNIVDKFKQIFKIYSLMTSNNNSTPSEPPKYSN